MAHTPFQLRSIGNNAIRNHIINGNFDIWQRGTSFLAMANGTVAADRFKYTKSGTMVHTGAQSVDVPTRAQSGFSSSYSLTKTVTTAQAVLGATDFSSFQYAVEGNDYSLIHGAMKVRLQFWVKSSIPGSYSVSIRNAAQDRSYVASYTINSANTWEKKNLDLPTDNSGVWLFDNGIGALINFVTGCGATYRTANVGQWQSGIFLSSTSQVNNSGTLGATFQLAQVKLCEGTFDSATDVSFSRFGDNIGQEFAACQRYYEIASLTDSFYALSNAFAYHFSREFVVEKRATPTMTVVSNGTSLTNFTSFVGVVGNTSRFRFEVTVPGGTATTRYIDAIITASAEL